MESKPRKVGLPWQAWLAAGLLALLFLAPFFRAQLTTPQGWKFSGSLSVSPDVMQYRAWLRQTQVEGPLVTNKFTAEPNRAHLFLPFYYLVGKLAGLGGLAPEWVYALSGAAFVFGFALLLFVLVDTLMGNRYQTWVVFLVILLAGGLDAHLLALANLRWVREIPLLFNSLVKGVWEWSPLVEQRGAYPFRAILETHFAMHWLFMTASLALIFLSLKTGRPAWRALAALSASLATVLHIYEGVTLLAILACVGLLAGLKKQLNRTVGLTLGLCAMGVLAGLGLLLAWQGRSGLPLPDWRGETVLFSTILLAYPLAWAMLAIGLGSYWRTAGLAEVFLLGWALGCLLVALSGPFYPYSLRGTLSLQIPLMILAGQIYFARWPRLTWPALAVIIFVGLLMPVREMKNLLDISSFSSSRPAVFLDQPHQALVQVLGEQAEQSDLMLVNIEQPGWQNDLLWLGPDYPGRFYCGHFFLCVDFERRRKEVSSFYDADPSQQQAFLEQNQIDLVFAGEQDNPQQLAQLPGMQLLIANQAGWLMRYRP